MIQIMRFFSLVLAALCLAFMAGCGSKPTGITLGEAYLKVMRPTDGNWSGVTNQNQPITFSVISNGMQIASHLDFTIMINESWGSGPLSLYWPAVVDIRNRSFSASGSSGGLIGTFTSPTQSHGTFSYKGWVNDGINNYYISYSGTWTASLAVSNSATIFTGAQGCPMRFRIGKAVEQTTISVRPKIDPAIQASFNSNMIGH